VHTLHRSQGLTTRSSYAVVGASLTVGIFKAEQDHQINKQTNKPKNRPRKRCRRWRMTGQIDRWPITKALQSIKEFGRMLDRHTCAEWKHERRRQQQQQQQGKQQKQEQDKQ